MFETGKYGSNPGIIRLNDSFKVSGPALYVNSQNQPTLPLGTVVIKETKAPAGYNLSSDTFIVTLVRTSDTTLTRTIYKNGTQVGSPVVRQLDAASASAGSLPVEDWNTLQSPETQIRGGVKISKINQATGKGDARFVGTEIAIVANGEVVDKKYNKTYADGQTVATLKIGADYTASTAKNALPAGNYKLKETKVVGPFTLDTTEKPFSITQNDVIVDLTKGPFSNRPIMGGVRVAKVDVYTDARAEGDMTFAGAEFTIYANGDLQINDTKYKKDDVVKVITTNANGVAETGARDLATGQYYIKETKAPKGYFVNSDYKATFKIGSTADDDGKMVVLSDANMKTTSTSSVSGWLTVTKGTANNSDPENPTPHPIKIIKRDSVFTNETVHGDADVSGIKFAVVNRSKGPVYNVATKKVIEPGQVVDVYTTNKNGEFTTPNLPLGTYEVIELRMDATIAAQEVYNGSSKLGSSILAKAGYLFKANTSTVVANEEGKTYEVNFTNATETGSIQITKTDAEITDFQGDASPVGIQYAIVNRSKQKVQVAGEVYAPGEVVKILSLDENGKASITALPYGTYDVVELSLDHQVKEHGAYADSQNGKSIYANQRGYLYEKKTVNIVAHEHGKTYPADFSNKPVRGGVSFLKIDKESKTAKAQGLATLKDATIEIYNISNRKVLVDGKEYAPNALVMTLQTDENGFTTTSDDALPFGTYYAVEKKESEGYLLNEAWKVTFQIREHGKIVDTSDPAAKVTAGNKVSDKSGWISVTNGLKVADEKIGAQLPEQKYHN